MSFYDVAIITVGSVSVIGAIVSGFLMNRHRRKIRVVGIVKTETGIAMPNWMLRLYESTFNPDSENTSSKG